MPMRALPSRAEPDFTLETSIKGVVAGVDEAGRGPWAGPLVVAAVILDANTIPAGINDSKRLTPAARDDLYDQIFETACGISIAVVSVSEIDRANILYATMIGML